MPLTGVGVKGGGITIPIEGEDKDFIASVDRVKKKLAELEGMAKSNMAMAKQIGQQQSLAAKQATMSWTDFRSMYSTVLDVVRAGQQVWAATGGEFVKYAEEVKNLSRNIGVTAEDASRLIQVADDVRISYASLGTAMKIAQKQGVDVSIDGLAKLADKYKSLAPGVERTQFLIQTFGKSGLEMGKLLEKGGDGVRKMSDEVKKGLIVTEQGIKDSDEYQASLDDLKDSFYAVQIEVGSNFVPRLKELSDQMLINLDEYEKFRQANGDLAEFMNYPLSTLIKWIAGMDENEEATIAAAGAQMDYADAAEEQTQSVKEAGDALKEYKDQLDAVSQANKDAESFIQSYADAQKSYAKEHAAAAEKLKEATAGGEEDEIAAATKAIQELEATWHESTQKMIYDMVLAKVSVDGLTDAEFKATQELAVQMGIRTQAEADQANAMMDTATALADGIALQEDVVREKAQTDADLLALEEAKAQAAAVTTDTIVAGASASVSANENVAAAVQKVTDAYYRQAAAARTAASSSGGTTSTRKADTHQSERYMDSGGVGFAGMEYTIGTGAQPEKFIAPANGIFIPNADKKGSGTTINIVVNNPKKETAEDSIRKNLKSLSYQGVLV